MIWGECHLGSGFRRLQAGEQGSSLPPPAPQASLSLFPRNRNRATDPASRLATLGRFYRPAIARDRRRGYDQLPTRSRPPRGREPQESHGNVQAICYDHQLLRNFPDGVAVI